MINFNDFFIVKYCSSYPGPYATDNYDGLTTSDVKLFLKYKNIWYRPWTNSVIKIKGLFEEYCETSEDIELMVNLYIEEGFLEKI